jgi:hypothetical protein
MLVCAQHAWATSTLSAGAQPLVGLPKSKGAWDLGLCFSRFVMNVYDRQVKDQHQEKENVGYTK